MTEPAFLALFLVPQSVVLHTYSQMSCGGILEADVDWRLTVTLITFFDYADWQPVTYSSSWAVQIPLLRMLTSKHFTADK